MLGLSIRLLFIALKCSIGVNLPTKLILFFVRREQSLPSRCRVMPKRIRKDLVSSEISLSPNRHLLWVMVVLEPKSSFLWI